MKVAITGAAGLFGQALVAVFSSRHVVFPLTRADADITDAESVRAALERIRPEVSFTPRLFLIWISPTLTPRALIW